MTFLVILLRYKDEHSLSSQPPPSRESVSLSFLLHHLLDRFAFTSIFFFRISCLLEGSLDTHLAPPSINLIFAVCDSDMPSGRPLSPDVDKKARHKKMKQLWAKTPSGKESLRNSKAKYRKTAHGKAVEKEGKRAYRAGWTDSERAADNVRQKVYHKKASDTKKSMAEILNVNADLLAKYGGLMDVDDDDEEPEPITATSSSLKVVRGNEGEDDGEDDEYKMPTIRRSARISSKPGPSKASTIVDDDEDVEQDGEYVGGSDYEDNDGSDHEGF
ncbi:hypothetical protein BT96DRAFT_1012802 [Gymnopus androsaceus JB14]|uniref:Uncharacterized protein n=1 Tax=Gymnopus androsaceus JB14 TaxID=1447944 RepID=A0A6A4IL76_9AGAR|nr:hypothetical protein BT96DRAFT_1012802 [Gymnopus androsaceus JB14]